jgi:hypothetical protein
VNRCALDATNDDQLFYTDYDVGEPNYRAHKPSLMPIAYHDRDDALATARDINARGGVAWEIETDGGATIGRCEIPRLIRDRAAQLIGLPRVR